MPPKKWGTTVNKSYGGGGGAKGTSVITDELNREVKYVSPQHQQPSSTPAAGSTASSSILNTRPAAAANAANPNNKHLSDDPRNRVLLETEVRSHIRKMIMANNLLGLPPAEVESMVDLILAATTRKEVFDWCSTLMLEEKQAVEIIHLRESHRIGLFSDGPSPAAATVAAPSAASNAAADGNGNGGKSGNANPTPSLQSLSQKPPRHHPDGPKILNATNGTMTANSGGSGAVPLNNTSAAPTVGSGTKKRGANSKALANVSQLGGGNSLVVGKFFECGCFAATHNFVSNCLNCGRIFCEQEMPVKAAEVGSYAARAGGMTTESIMCYACGQDPNKNITYEIKLQQGLIDSMSANKAEKGYREAVERRDQLMLFARERAKRTTVVDDQGVGGIAYGTNTAWMTEDEVEAMEEKERKARVAEMHKHSGAYRVHLDIVNQSVALGATAAVGENNNTSTDCSSAAQSCAAGFKTDAAAAGAATNAWGTVPSATAQGAPAATAEESDEADEDAAYDSEEEGARRVLPLPTLLQKLWYTADDTTANSTNSATNGGKWDTTRVGDNASSALATAGPTVLDLKPTTHRGAIASKRVQNDYFEDDDVAYRVEREDFIFKMKRALLEEEEEGANNGGGNKKKVTSSSTLGPSSSPSAAAGPTIDRESFSENGIGSSDKLDTATANAIGAAMAAGGRVGDQGMCLSLHQPWASLLVAGIKIHEGRSWPSDFKGRLWIHAAAATYSANEIEAIEEQHRAFLRANGTEKDKKFPTNYPTSCLLGYVNVSEVISIDEYKRRIPQPELRQELGESGYVFMCEKGARMLPFTLPMEGKHKIYKLERKIWNAARKQFGEE